MLLLLERSFSLSKSKPPPAPAFALSTHSSRPVGLDADMRLRWAKGAEAGVLGKAELVFCETILEPAAPLSGSALTLPGVESRNITSADGGGGGGGVGGGVTEAGVGGSRAGESRPRPWVRGVARSACSLASLSLSSWSILSLARLCSVPTIIPTGMFAA